METEKYVYIRVTSKDFIDYEPGEDENRTPGMRDIAEKIIRCCRETNGAVNFLVHNDFSRDFEDENGDCLNEENEAKLIDVIHRFVSWSRAPQVRLNYDDIEQDNFDLLLNVKQNKDTILFDADLEYVRKWEELGGTGVYVKHKDTPCEDFDGYVLNFEDSKSEIRNNVLMITQYLKYELTDETIEYKGHVLHRIRALRYIFPDIGFYIRKGELGGYVENENNLSQYGECWISQDAMAIENARVKDDAIVDDNAMIGGNAVVADAAVVADKAIVVEDALIGGRATVCENARVSGRTLVVFKTVICGDAEVSLNETPLFNHPVYNPNLITSRVVTGGTYYTAGRLPEKPGSDKNTNEGR